MSASAFLSTSCSVCALNSASLNETNTTPGLVCRTDVIEVRGTRCMRSKEFSAKKTLKGKMLSTQSSHIAGTAMNGRYSFQPRKKENNTWISGEVHHARIRYSTSSRVRMRKASGGSSNVSAAGTP